MELEQHASDEIREQVAARLKSLLDTYSVLSVGHITRFPEPVSHSSGVAEAWDALMAAPEVNALPVEGDSGVIGIVHKRDLAKKKGAWTDPSVEKFVDTKALSIDASESSEKAMEQVLKRDPERLYDDFMVYKRGKFFGVGTFSDLSRNLAEIRNADLDKARTMQEFFMSRNAIAEPAITVDKYVRMAHGIGGDYVQCMQIRDKLSMVSAFDVSGKGTAAALLTGILSAYFSTLKICGFLATLSPGSLLDSLNNVIIDQTPKETFIAGAFMFADHEKKEVTLYNCGYTPPFVFYLEAGTGKAKGKVIKPDHWPLGIDKFVDKQGWTLPFQKSLRVFMYSDGLTEARNKEGEEYGDERLRKFLAPRCMKSGKLILGDLDKEISDHVGPVPQTDDITAVVAEIA